MDVDPGMHYLGSQSRRRASPPPPSARLPSHETCWPGTPTFASQESVFSVGSADLIPDVDVEEENSSSQMSCETLSTDDMTMPGTRATTPVREVPQSQGLQRMQSIHPLGRAISIDLRALPAPAPPLPTQPSADTLRDFLQKHLTQELEGQAQQIAALAKMTQSMRDGMAALVEEARLLREEAQRASAVREEAQKAAAARARGLRPSAGKRTQTPRHPQ